MNRANTLKTPDAWPDYVGRIGLFVFFFFFQLNATVAYVSLILMLLVFLHQWKHWLPILKRDPVLYLYLILSVFIPSYALLSAREFPETAEDQWTATANFMQCMPFIPVAWQVARNGHRLNWMLLALLLGVATRMLTHMDWQNLAHVFEWQRTGFGYSEIVFSVIVSIVTLALCLLAGRMIGPESPSGNWSRRIRFLLWLLSLLVFLEAMVLHQTRAAWLAAALVLPLALIARYRDWLRNHAFKSLSGFAVLVMCLLIVGALIAKNSGTILGRLHAEPEAVQTLMKGDLEKTHSVSIGARLDLWRIGLKRWSERPWFGWGPGTTELLIRQANQANLNIHPHLHNLYLETLVRFGAIGGLLFASLGVLLLKGLWKATRQGEIPWDYACFLLAGWGFVAIFMFFDFQFFKFVWRNFCVIWAALTYAAQLEPAFRVRTEDCAEHP